MKSSMRILSVLLSVVTLGNLPAMADENPKAAMALCDCSNPANGAICSRLQQSSGLERDTDHANAQNHGQDRQPASSFSRR